MDAKQKTYLINDKEVTEAVFINELNYQLKLEKRQNISHGKFTQDELFSVVMNNEKKSTFFEVGNKKFKCYPNA